MPYRFTARAADFFMMTLSRVPSFSDRPGFPAGLKVLVVDPNENDLKLAAAQLKECNYEVHGCSSEAQALMALNNVEGRFDVIMCETSVVAEKDADSTSLVSKIGGVPLILMGQNSTQQQLMLGVNLGAVDFLEKPVSALKLRNIWQHTVRKMLKGKGSKRRSKTVDITSRLAQAPAAQPGPSAAGPKSSDNIVRERQQESTGSSEADMSGAKQKLGVTTASNCAQPSAPAVQPSQMRRSSSQPVHSQTASTAVPGSTAPIKSATPVQYPSPSSMQYCMQGMPAPLPGCVWGLPMLPPPVPGLMGSPMPWPSAAPMAPYMQPMAASHPSQWYPKPAPTGSVSMHASSQPTYGSLPQMHRAATAPQGTLPGMPPLAAAAPPPVGPLADKAAAGCTSASNEHSDNTWQQPMEWPGMEDVFDLDDADDPQDICHLLTSAAEYGLPTDFDLTAPSAAGRPRSAGNVPAQDDLDASFALLDEEDDPIGIKGFPKTPSFLDIMDNWGSADGEVAA